MLNAQTAFSNHQHEATQEWCEKAIFESPREVQAYSIAGKASLLMSKRGDGTTDVSKLASAVKYFQKAVELDSATGEHYFDLGNAKFGLKKYSEALKNYAFAEQYGCSDEIQQELYYQMGVLNQMNEDFESALLNYAKAESVPILKRNHAEIVLNRFQIYFTLGSWHNAENCAIQLKLLEPGEYRSHKLYFQVLLQQNNLEKAEDVLKEAGVFFVGNNDVQIDLMFDRVLLYCFKAELDSENMEKHFNVAISILTELGKIKGLPKEAMCEINLTMSDIYFKLEKRDKSIVYAKQVCEITRTLMDTLSVPVQVPLISDEISEDELDELTQAAIRDVEDSGLLDSVEIEMDEDGNAVAVVPDDVTRSLMPLKEIDSGESTSSKESPQSDNLTEYFERATFLLAECYVEEGVFETALDYIRLLRHSENVFYQYYSRYMEALAVKKLAKNNSENLQKSLDLYNQAIAFFRKKTFENPSDVVSVVFRVKSYADIGKYEKADELAKVLAIDVREPLIDYIQQLKSVE